MLTTAKLSVPKPKTGKPRNYAYYRCIGTDAYRFGGQRVCSNTQVRTDLLESAVWLEVRQLLENPQQTSPKIPKCAFRLAFRRYMR